MTASPALSRRARIVRSRLATLYPGSAEELCALVHANPFQLVVATILSAQCTDTRVNQVTPGLFSRYPDAAALAGAEPGVVEALVRPTGFYRAKTRHLLGMARHVVERFDGEIPSCMDDLVTLPGVGRKTANVVRSVGFALPGLPVDTHVGRVARRLALTTATDPVRVEEDLGHLVPPPERGVFSLRLIEHGRAVCRARRPACDRCGLSDVCPACPPVPAGRGGRGDPAMPGGEGPGGKRAPGTAGRRRP
ncbi:MAG: endonuclease III [Actinomycetota bacterium]|jgi:endonuclease-3|nr:endonuclease III [Actinomycetota bacterium]